MPGIPPVGRRTTFTDTPATEPTAEAVRPQPEQPPASAAKAEMDRAEAEYTVKTLNRVLNPLDLNMQIQFDDETNRYGFKIVDRRTNEVIREFPTPGVLEAARDAVAGMFVDQRG
jgi:flagellar protein FlaG